LCCYSANLCEISKSSAILCEILSQLSFGKFFLLCNLPYKNLGNFGFRCLLKHIVVGKRWFLEVPVELLLHWEFC
jgi:hypothetical protein